MLRDHFVATPVSNLSIHNFKKIKKYLYSIIGVAIKNLENK